jgi:TusA-related sulfurtransferase
MTTKTPERGVRTVLDITSEVCPLTFVRTKLLIEHMAPGETADILLRGAEPLANVPRAVVGLGHHVLELVPLDEPEGVSGIHRMRIRKSPGRSASTELATHDHGVNSDAVGSPVIARAPANRP